MNSEERVDPGVVTVALLYKIANRLEKIEKVLSAQLPLGIALNIPDGLSLTAGDTYVDFIKGLVSFSDGTKRDIPTFRVALFSISIENQGAAACIVVINHADTWGKKTLDSGDIYNLDMKKAAIEDLKLTVAAGGACTVQIAGVI